MKNIEILKCCHCLQSPEVLVLLQPGDAKKHICIKCFTVRHPELSRDTLELLLDEEQKQETIERESHKPIITTSF